MQVELRELLGFRRRIVRKERAQERGCLALDGGLAALEGLGFLNEVG